MSSSQETQAVRSRYRSLLDSRTRRREVQQQMRDVINTAEDAVSITLTLTSSSGDKETWVFPIK